MSTYRPIGEGPKEHKRLSRYLGGSRTPARFRKIIRNFRSWPVHLDYGLAVLTTPGPRSGLYRYDHMLPKIEGNTLRDDLARKWALHRD